MYFDNETKEVIKSCIEIIFFGKKTHMILVYSWKLTLFSNIQKHISKKVQTTKPEKFEFVKKENGI